MERTFGVLRQCWQCEKSITNIVFKNNNNIRNIIYVCIILHNIILEDKNDVIYNYDETNIQPSYEQKRESDS